MAGTSTIRMGYIEAEDRLLVEFIDAESKVTLLFTRRVTRRVIRGIAQLLARSSRAMAHAAVEHKTEVLVIEHQSALQSVAAAGANSAAPSDSPVAPGPPPDLLGKLDVRTMPRFFRLSFHGCAGVSRVIDVTRPDLHRLLATLHRLARLAGWNIEGEVGWLAEAEAPIIPPAAAS
jgi:hypothetical protein